jgi:hypothetical protein
MFFFQKTGFSLIACILASMNTALIQTTPERNLVGTWKLVKLNAENAPGGASPCECTISLDGKALVFKTKAWGVDKYVPDGKSVKKTFQLPGSNPFESTTVVQWDKATLVIDRQSGERVKSQTRISVKGGQLVIVTESLEIMPGKSAYIYSRTK